MEETFSYDRIPYPSKIFSQTNPDRLATMARLYGIEPPDFENCRVLELGCGNGSNLLAQSFVFPEIEFVGIDLAENHIADAKQSARELNLPNVVFHQMDVMQMQPEEFGKFDFIIAHGLISWIPEAVRERVFEIYRENLQPNGVGYVSYNAYPGAHLREMTRRMMRYHTRDCAEPLEKVQKAITFLAFLTENSVERKSFQPVLKSELERHFEHDTADIFHDDLADFYQPFYFSEFASLLEKHGLQYLSEAEVAAMSTASFSKEARQMLENLDAIEREQYMDFLRGRFFRQTLVCRKEIQPNRGLEPARLRDFYLSAEIRPLAEKPDFAPEKVEKFAGKKNIGFEIDHPLTKAALAFLGEIWGNSAGFAEIVENARRILRENKISANDAEKDEQILEAILWQLFYDAGAVEINVYRRKISSAEIEKPKVNRLARWQINRGQNISTLFGTSIKIEDDVSRHLIELMDGTRAQAELLTEMKKFVETGAQDVPDRREFLNDLPNWLRESIRHSARMALFE
jgi:methyltransferase-like protein/2-polyprenyl-3-methyl-5-hydroxy-6-metoxy-1,4-benzoquinol methylase